MIGYECNPRIQHTGGDHIWQSGTGSFPMQVPVDTQFLSMVKEELTWNGPG